MWWRVVAVGTAAALLVAACGGGGDDDDGGDGDDQEDEPEVAESEAQEPQDAGDEEDEPQVELREFVSRPDITPPVIDVTASGSTAPGLLFLGPKQAGAQTGALIIDNEGEVVFASPQDDGATDVRVQTFRGEPVITWWQGRSANGVGDGEFVIVDSSYEEVARFPAGNGLNGDLHEFQLTDQGTALVVAYEPEPADLTEQGGPADGFVYENHVQEVDVETGEVLFDWRAGDHVPVSDTVIAFGEGPNENEAEPGSEDLPFDWFHVNSVAEGDDDTLLVSARNTSTVYAIDRQSGELRWRLGGSSSDFELGDQAVFGLQHDAQRQPDGTISIFDNGDEDAGESRALFLDIDETTGTAEVVRELRHPDGIWAPTQGNTQLLGTGGVVVGWGSEGRISEYSPDGDLAFDASFGPADTYRAYRFDWEGQPQQPPDIAVRSADDALDAYVSWNGATAVTDWRILAGDDPENLAPVTTAAKDGFETRISIDAAAYVAVEALDGSGEILGTSDPQPTA